MAGDDGGVQTSLLSLFCARLRRLQQAAGITQTSLAAAVHLGTSQMSDILNGKIKRVPDWDVVYAIVRACLDHTETKGRPAPPDLRDERDWRRRYNDLQQDFEVAAQPARSRKPTEAGTARLAYLQQVRRIAPPELIGRETELAELAKFCLEPGCGPYVWWQAGAWAGKSALLSTFVLYPPPEVRDRVRVVSFFITARLAGQDTREAFTQVLLDQLATLTGKELPAVLPEVTREAYLLDLLAQAAAACREGGGRLVLVVDGLDEDLGVTTGPDAHSIAALLPADPPAGMRVIVAGRPNPPIPDDVPDWHSLRDPGIIRPLLDSPHARDLQRLSRQELRRLLQGARGEQDLLGLLTTARGGLSGFDLEELTGAPLWKIEEILHTVVGRTFTRRASRWAPGTGPEVYLLAHEELQASSNRYLGSRRLAEYCDRLHDWFDTYRERGWPPATPEYLLSGYYRLLVTLDDLPRMIVCAGDPARHDRMLALTGGDAAAQAEIRATLDLIAAQDAPDPASGLRLAYYRDRLTDRNANVPVGLPAVWATLENATHAEALAASITDPARQAEALEQIVAALTGAGAHERAEAVARLIADPAWQARVLAEVAAALARTGAYERAGAVTSSITDLSWQVQALAQVVGALAGAGQYREATALAEQAEAVARSIASPVPQARALAQVAVALVGAGVHEQAEVIARSIQIQRWRAQTLTQVAAAMAGAGAYERAEALARSITNQGWQAKALADVARVLADAGAYEQAETLARSITSRGWQAQALADVARVLADAGAYEQAETLARSITSSVRRTRALAQLARTLAGAGHHQKASAVARRAGAVARSITDPNSQARVLAEVAEVLAGAGAHERAEVVARSITNPRWQADVLVQIAKGLARAGHRQEATAVAERTDALIRSISSPDSDASALADVAGALAMVGAHEQAEAVARSIADPDSRARALAQVASALAEAGAYEQAKGLARSIADPDSRARALTQVAGTLAKTEAYKEAWAVARSIANPKWQTDVLVQIAKGLAGAGQRKVSAIL